MAFHRTVSFTSTFFFAALAVSGCDANKDSEAQGESSGTSGGAPAASSDSPQTTADPTAASDAGSSADDGESASTTGASEGSSGNADGGAADDSAESSAGDGSESSGGAATGDLRVFVTSTSFTGNMNGVYGADELCQASADSVGLGGAWRAWLGTSLAEPHEGIVGEGPWVDMEGTVIFMNRGGLLVDPLARIKIDERGDERFESVWTGSSGQHCDNWTSEDGLGGYGVTDDGAEPYDWTNRGDDTCDVENHLYCFEAPTE